MRPRTFRFDQLHGNFSQEFALANYLDPKWVSLVILLDPNHVPGVLSLFEIHEIRLGSIYMLATA
jgi:hypothetical protein